MLKIEEKRKLKEAQFLAPKMYYYVKAKKDKKTNKIIDVSVQKMKGIQ